MKRRQGVATWWLPAAALVFGRRGEEEARDEAGLVQEKEGRCRIRAAALRWLARWGNRGRGSEAGGSGDGSGRIPMKMRERVAAAARRIPRN